jgi:adrenodoxin-NADP+ reductase
MNDAFATADSIVEDWYNRVPFLSVEEGDHLGWEGVKDEAEKRGCRRVSWEDWKKIDSVERSNGLKMSKAREKFTKVGDMLAVLK